MNTPLISIIINNYNYASFLQKSIDSALNQSYPNIEVIVVDDGSTDHSQKIIEGYGSRITAAIQENGGQASAMNEGYRLSHGEFLIFLDADDELMPDAATEVASRFADNPKVALVQYRLQVIDADGKALGGVLPPLRLAQPSGDISGILRKNRVYVHPPTSGNAFRRSIIDSLMPIPENIYVRAPLSYLMYLIGLYGHVESINANLGKYRMHGKNVSETNLAFNPIKLKAYLGFSAFSRNEQVRIFKERYGVRISRIAPGDVTYIKNSVILKKLYPQHYPYNDTLLGLCLRGIVAAFIADNLRIRERLVWIAWFSGMLFSTRNFSTRLVEQLSEPNKRFPIIKMVLGDRTRRHGG